MPFTLVHYPTLPSAEFEGSTGNGDWADCLAQMDHNVGRPIDGVDQRDLLTGATESSAREGFPIFFGDKLYAAKWRDFKLHFVWQVNATDPVLPLGIPAVFNLLTNPRDNTNENLATTHVWVITAASKMLADFQASLQAYPPIPSGASDPYLPVAT